MKTNNKAVILIVDDKSANIMALDGLLTTEDRHVLHAASGEEALKILLNTEVDLVILDVQMPDMDGFEVASILKSGRRTRDIPIIFASAERTERRFMVKGFEEGAVDYLYKPLDPEIVKAKVAILLKIQLQKRELEENNKRLNKSALLINNSADMIGVIDATTFEIEEANNAFTVILGYDKSELEGTPLTSFLEEKDKAALKLYSANSSTQLTFETCINCKDKTTKWLHWNVVVRDGKWYANARDVTGGREMNAQIKKLNADLLSYVSQLEHSNKELESFSYSISHDLRAPLRALNGYSRIMEEDYGKVLSDDARRLLGNIKYNSQKMGVLIDDLLDFSRLGRKEVKKAKVNMNDLVKNVLAEMETPVIKLPTVQVTQLPDIFADGALIRQVWVNLISNAVKYSSKRATAKIIIGASESDTEVTYFVKDNGAGFDMRYVDKLFGVFQRLHDSSEFEGTGIGLAIVQRVIAKHKGKAWAEGELNKGSTFYFSLPK